MEFVSRNMKDLMADLFSALLAGFLIVFVTGCALAFPALILLDNINAIFYKNYHMTTTISDLSEGIFKIFGNSGSALIVIMISYIIGTLYTWRNPNLLDSISYQFEKERFDDLTEKRDEREKKRKENKENVDPMPNPPLFSPAFIKNDVRAKLNIWVDPINDWPYSCIHSKVKKYSRKIARRLPFRSGDYNKYPYINLIQYLNEREFGHLATKITWDPNKSSTLAHRTKLFIDTLKLNIGIVSPKDYISIARNEAHIRLLAAIGYSIRFLWMLTFCMMLIGVILEVWGCYGTYLPESIRFQTARQHSPNDVFVFIVPFILLMLCCTLEKMILNVFHRLRVREVLNILTIAHIHRIDTLNYYAPPSVEK